MAQKKSPKILSRRRPIKTVISTLGSALGLTLGSAALTLGAMTCASAAALPIVISDNDWKPWYFSGVSPASGEKSGFAKDVIGICARQTGFAPTFRLYPIERMRTMMKRGGMEGSIFSYKPHRKAFLIYSEEPIFRESYVPFMRANSDAKITRIADFDGLRLGHLHGLTYAPHFLAYVEKRRGSGTLDITTSHDANIRKLVSGKIDVFVDTIGSIRWRSAELGLSNRITDVRYVIRNADYYFTLSRASKVISDKAKFIAQFDACVRGLKKTERYRDIARKYGMTLRDLKSLKK